MTPIITDLITELRETADMSDDVLAAAVSSPHYRQVLPTTRGRLTLYRLGRAYRLSWEARGAETILTEWQGRPIYPPTHWIGPVDIRRYRIDRAEWQSGRAAAWREDVATLREECAGIAADLADLAERLATLEPTTETV